MPAAAARRAPRQLVVPVRVRGLDANLRQTAGVGVFDAATGAGFSWTPLAAVEPTNDGSIVVEVKGVARGTLCITLATAREHAQHAWLARATLPTGSGTTTEVLLAAETTNVQLTLPDGVERAGPLRLSRRDDPHWLPSYLGPIGITIERAAPTSLLLAAGSYELSDPIDPTRRLGFDVPVTSAVTLSEDLALRPGVRR